MVRGLIGAGLFALLTPLCASALQTGDCAQALTPMPVAEKAARIWGALEDFWKPEMKQRGVTLKKSKLIIYSKKTNTAGCDLAKTEMGPFYCAADDNVYFDPEFLTEMHELWGSHSEVNLAVILAHEFGHHVQQNAGVTNKVSTALHSLLPEERDTLTKMTELSTDSMAGYFFGYLLRSGSADAQDIHEATQALGKLGDDAMAKSAGVSLLEMDSHGTSRQRKMWFQIGLDAGSIDDLSAYRDPQLQHEFYDDDLAQNIARFIRYPSKVKP
jgi:predicted metalloprotease